MVVALKRTVQFISSLALGPIRALLVVVLLAGCEARQTVVTVGQTAIDIEQFRSRYRQFLLDTPLKDNLQSRYLFADALIDEILFLQWADSTGLASSEGALKDLGDMRDQLLLEGLYRREIGSRLVVTESDARLMYAWSKIRLHTRQLFARDLTQAEALLSQLEAGVTWEALAAGTFKDRQLAGTGGDLGFNDLGDLEPEFEQAAYRLKDGEISAPVSTQAGYRIIQVVEREVDPFLVEAEFTQRRKKYESLALAQKRPARLRSYTDSILISLDLNFDGQVTAQLAAAWGAISTGSSEWSLDFEATPIVELGGGADVWSAGEAARKLSNLPAWQRNAIDGELAIRRALSGLAIQEHLLRKANHMGLGDGEAFKRRSKKLRGQYLISEVLSHISDRATATENEIADYFEDHRADFVTPERYEIAEIVVPDGTLADELIVALKLGANFGDLAAKHSGRRSTAAVDGYLGWGTLEQFGALKTALRGSAAGELLGPHLVAGQYVILQVLDASSPRNMTLEETTPDIIGQLSTLTRRRAYNDFRSQLRAHQRVAVDSLLLGTFDADPGKLSGDV